MVGDHMGILGAVVFDLLPSAWCYSQRYSPLYPDNLVCMPYMHLRVEIVLP